jgi:decaprenylphospho-beta-D-erythro-pentofuranosid-2-ulose 2-reductase
MRDAFGRIQSVALLGGGSDIGVGAVTRLVHELGVDQVVLAGRNPDRFAPTAASLAGATTRLVAFDATEHSGHAAAFDEIFSGADIDVVIIAFGKLMPETGVDTDVDAVIDMLETNYVGAVSALLRAAQHLTRQGHGHIVVLSSIAGQRARPDNFLYGSTRAGLDFVARGMLSHLAAAGIRLSIIRPGFVHSKMTTGWKPAPFSVTADHVAEIIVKEIAHPSSPIVWVPPIMRWIAMILKILPASILSRLR